MVREKFIDQLGKLVEISTISSDSAANSMALDIVESWVNDKSHKLRVKNGNAEILLLGSGDLINPKVGYLVHMDVVEGQPSQFRLTHSGNKLLGRGVSDMKFSIPIGVELLNQTITGKSDNDFTLAITTDEEVGGGEGGKHLADVLQFRPGVLVVPDGGDGFVLVNKSKGVAHVWVESTGKPAHASTPWLGKNALTPLCRLAANLLNKYDQNSRQENWETTMNIGSFSGGKSVNQVCPEAVLRLDFRFPETRTVDEILAEIKQLAAGVDPTLKAKITASGDPTFTDVKSEPVRKLQQASQEILGHAIAVIGECGASDARYWARYHTPIIMTKPEGGGIHSDDEWINSDSCLTFYSLISRYLAIL